MAHIGVIFIGESEKQSRRVKTFRWRPSIQYWVLMVQNFDFFQLTSWTLKNQFFKGQNELENGLKGQKNGPKGSIPCFLHFWVFRPYPVVPIYFYSILHFDPFWASQIYICCTYRKVGFQVLQVNHRQLLWNRLHVPKKIMKHKFFGITVASDFSIGSPE